MLDMAARHLRRLLTLTLLFLTTTAGATQGLMHDYDVKQWTAQDGLSSQSIRTITQDRLGYIWVGSKFGLNRFDGYKFEVFNTQNTKEKLVSNGINKVFVDSSGYLWVGTKLGLSGVDPATLNFSSYFIQQEVSDIVETRSKAVLVAAGGLFKIIDKSINKVKQIQGEVRKLEVFDGGTWVITDSTLYLLKDDNTIANTIEVKADIGESIIRDMLYSEQEGLFVATEIGAFRVSEQNLFQTNLVSEEELFPADDSAQEDVFEQETLPVGQEIPVHKILKDSNDGLWLSTFGSLYFRNLKQAWQPVVAEQLGHNGWFADIFEDRDKNIWLASSSDGLWRASVSRITRHVPDNVPSSAISSVTKGPNGRLWLGTQRGVVSLDNDDDYALMIKANVLYRQNIYGMEFLDDKVLLATESGLLVYQGGKVDVPHILGPIQWSNVKVISKHSENGFWIGTSQGLYEYKDDRLIPFHLNGEFDSKSITFILDKGNDSWIGTTRGLYKYDGNSLLPMGQSIAVYRRFITSILDLGELGVLVSTLDHGLFFKSSNGGWTHYDESNGLANGIIVALHYQEDKKMIWVSTHKGVYRFESALLEKSSDNFQIENILSQFDRQLGSASGRCCNGFGHHKIADFDGSLWFPSNNGVVEIPKDIDPYGDASERIKPIIQSIVTNNRKIVIGNEDDFQLDLNERDFTVFYSTLNFNLPQAEVFRYRLEGYDSEWQEVEKLRQVGFTNLPSGTFDFTVQTKLLNQSWEEAKQTSIRVKIPKQFNETMLYRILVGVLIVLVAYGASLLIRNRERRKRATLRELVDQRTTELQSVNAQLNEANQQLKQLSHKDELSGLRNRHFVFEQLPKDIEHYQRNRESMISQGKSFALIVINIDGFKHVNDSHGPIAGDSVLSQFAVLLTRETRGSDYVVRWGGDEFLIVLRDSQSNQIESFIYELNLAVANGEFYLPDGQNIKVTCSIGYALYPLELIGGQLINWEVSLSLADMALHQVKNAGRNGWATVEFDDQVDAFEFEDNDALEAFVEQLFATGAARFNVRLADTNFTT